MKEIYSTNAALRKALGQLIDGTFADGNSQIFRDLYQTLMYGDYGYPDTYMVLRDFEDYAKMQAHLSQLYKNLDLWLKKAIMNTAFAGFFSSDRTIREYNEKIWKLKPIQAIKMKKQK